jgi:hypothetical protein
MEYRVQATWMSGQDVVMWGLPLNDILCAGDAHNMAYAIRDGLRLYGYDAEVVISTEAAVE